MARSNQARKRGRRRPPPRSAPIDAQSSRHTVGTAAKRAAITAALSTAEARVSTITHALGFRNWKPKRPAKDAARACAGASALTRKSEIPSRQRYAQPPMVTAVRQRGCAVNAGPIPASAVPARATEPRTIPAIAGNAPRTPPAAAARKTMKLLGPGVRAATTRTPAADEWTSIETAITEEAYSTRLEHRRL